jgi:hypothetical protein
MASTPSGTVSLESNDFSLTRSFGYGNSCFLNEKVKAKEEFRGNCRLQNYRLP